MPLAALLSPAAAKDLDALPTDLRRQVVADIESYAAEPLREPPRVKKLRGFKPPLFRLRSGDYRILFREAGVELHVYRVVDRKELERALKRLR